MNFGKLIVDSAGSLSASLQLRHVASADRDQAITRRAGCQGKAPTTDNFYGIYLQLGSIRSVPDPLVRGDEQGATTGLADLVARP